MTIKADEQGKELIRQVQDALLRGHGLAAVQLVNELNDVEDIEDTKEGN